MQNLVVYRFFEDESENSIIARLDMYNRELSSEQINSIMDIIYASHFD